MRWPWQSKRKAAVQLKAAQQRAFAHGLQRSFHNAAKTGRRTDKWGARASGPNSASATGGAELRKRARHQTRNSPHAAKAKHLFVSSIVGDGVRPQIKTGDPELDKVAEKLWADWSEVCDTDGRNDFYGLQRLVASTIPDAGECIVRRRPQDTAAGLPVPLQLQIMEADHIDNAKSTTFSRGASRSIQGIEFDDNGKRAAYWLFPFHPSDDTGTVTGWSTSERIPASEIAHVYHCDRPGSVRGLPWMAPIMMLLEDLEAYMDAEVLRKRVEACMVGIYSGARTQHLTPASNGAGGDAPITDIDGVPMGDMQPGEFYLVDADAELTIHQPTAMGGIEEFVRVVLRQVATGLGTTYELLAGDLSKVNFSSGRMGNIEWRRLARALSKVLIVRQFCQPTFDWWLTLAIASGALPAAATVPAGEYLVDWVAPHFEEVDRKKDVDADTAELTAGLATYRGTLARKGIDMDQHVEQLAAERQKLNDLGIEVDWSPVGLPAPSLPAVPVDEDAGLDSDTIDPDDDATPVAAAV